MALPSTTPPHALLAGGGTGGHVYPAVALARELAGRGWAVTLAGLAGGLEARVAASHGLEFAPLAARPMVGRGAAAKGRAMATLLASSLRMRGEIRRRSSRVVVGTGGYVAAPAVLGGRLAGRPVLLFEPNARAGYANRKLSRWATAAAVAWDGAAVGLACPSERTGIPVRTEFFRQPLVATGPSRLLVLGGSQGARQLNELLPAALELVAPTLPGLSVVHQSGPAGVEATREAYACRRLPGIEVEVEAYLEDVASAMGAATLVVSRAGAITLAELCAVGRPALLVPLSGLALGHQEENARQLADSGGAYSLVGEAASVAATAAALQQLLADREALQEMGERLRRLAVHDAAGRLADCVERLGGRA